MRRGAEVFPNASCVGAADLVLKINGTLYEFDVKTARMDYNVTSGKPRWVAKNLFQIKPPQWPIIVIPEDTGYLVRWSNLYGTTSQGNESTPKCPKGLEIFWNEIIN